MATAFQRGAFQFNAFQIAALGAVGPRLVPQKELDRLLKLQRNNTFGRRWFEDYEKAQREYAVAEAAAIAIEEERARREAEELRVRSAEIERERRESDKLKRILAADVAERKIINELIGISQRGDASLKQLKVLEFMVDRQIKDAAELKSKQQRELEDDEDRAIELLLQ